MPVGVYRWCVVHIVYSWMQSNHLQLKLELLVSSINYHGVHSGLGLTPPYHVNRCVWSAIFIDADLSMTSRVQWTVTSYFAVLCQLRSIWRSLLSTVYKTLVVTHVLTWLDYCNATLAGIPATLFNHLQSVLNAAARSIAGLHRSAHTTNTLASFHWLCTSEQIQIKLHHSSSTELFTSQCLITFPTCCIKLADIPSWSHLHCQLDVRPSCWVTVGDRSFVVTGPRIWNSLPGDITSIPLLSVFRRKLKTHLFQQSYPDIAP